MALSRASDIVLRVGAAFAFLYPPVNALGDPNAWIGYFPSFLLGAASHDALLHGFGAIEAVIALWLLSGWRVFYPAAIATAMLLAIVLFNIPQMQILFRDLSIASITLALALSHFPKRSILLANRTLS
jgi:hypothetical protein